MASACKEDPSKTCSQNYHKNHRNTNGPPSSSHFTFTHKGKGGKYLVVGPDFKGDIPKGYFVLKKKTYRHWLLMRTHVVDGKTQQAIDSFKK